MANKAVTMDKLVALCKAALAGGETIEIEIL